MILYFKNGRGQVRKIGKIDGRMSMEKAFAEANRQIKVFCDERNFEINYVRVWNTELSEGLNRKLVTMFDVGSHTEFFYTYPICRSWNE